MTIYKSNLHRCNRRFRDSWKSLKGTHLPSPLHSLQRLEKVKNSLWTEWNSSLFIWIAKDSLNWHLGSKQELDQKELNGIILNTWCLKHLQKPAKCLSHSVLSNSLWPHDGSLPGSSVHEILQARILERVATSRESPPLRGQTWVYLHSRQILYLTEPWGWFANSRESDTRECWVMEPGKFRALWSLVSKSVTRSESLSDHF